MIKRKAIIIGNSGGYRNLDFLSGVSVDLENYHNFLTSKAGGEWHPNEISILKDPTSSDVIKAIQESESDYTFIVFSGHGFISTYNVEDYVCLKDVDLSIGKLVSPSKKQTIVIDACREFHPHKPDFLMEEKYSNFSGDEERSTRALFDEAIIKTPEGIILVFSTQSNGTSGDNEFLGGVFSYSFIKAGERWWEDEKTKGVLTLNVAVEKSKLIIKETFITNQTPEMAGQIRRLTFPPFAISKH